MARGSSSEDPHSLVPAFRQVVAVAGGRQHSQIEVVVVVCRQVISTKWRQQSLLRSFPSSVAYEVRRSHTFRRAAVYGYNPTFPPQLLPTPPPSTFDVLHRLHVREWIFPFPSSQIGTPRPSSRSSRRPTPPFRLVTLRSVTLRPNELNLPSRIPVHRCLLYQRTIQNCDCFA